MYDYDLHKWLQAKLKNKAPATLLQPWGHLHSDYNSRVAVKHGGRAIVVVNLPCWIEQDPPFPEGQMLHFMGLIPKDRRRAKPEDWYDMIITALREASPESIKE